MFYTDGRRSGTVLGDKGQPLPCGAATRRTVVVQAIGIHTVAAAEPQFGRRLAPALART